MAMRKGELRRLRSLSLCSSEMQPAGAEAIIDQLAHCPLLRGRVVEMGSLPLYSWAVNKWGSARPDLELTYPNGRFAGRYTINFRSRIQVLPAILAQGKAAAYRPPDRKGAQMLAFPGAAGASKDEQVAPTPILAVPGGSVATGTPVANMRSGQHESDMGVSFMGDWICSECTFVHATPQYRTFLTCEICGLRRDL